jgi:hypothetical protein
VDVNSLLNYIALGFSAVALPLSFILPGIIAGQQRRAIAASTRSSGTKPGVPPGTGPDALKPQVGSLPMAYLQQLIVGAALNEGAAFFAAIVYLIGKNSIALGLALVLIAGLVARFPTEGRVERWIERQQEKLVEDQHKVRSSS